MNYGNYLCFEKTLLRSILIGSYIQPRHNKVARFLICNNFDKTIAWLAGLGPVTNSLGVLGHF